MLDVTLFEKVTTTLFSIGKPQYWRQPKETFKVISMFFRWLRVMKSKVRAKSNQCRNVSYINEQHWINVTHSLLKNGRLINIVVCWNSDEGFFSIPTSAKCHLNITLPRKSNVEKTFFKIVSKVIFGEFKSLIA